MRASDGRGAGQPDEPRHRPADEAVERSFHAEPAAPTEARSFVVETLADWGLADLVDDAALVASELATNAVRHVGGPFRVRLVPRDQGVRLAVVDRGRGWPRPAEAPGADGGFGLVIVANASHRWGVDDLGADGKAVWADLR